MVDPSPGTDVEVVSPSSIEVGVVCTNVDEVSPGVDEVFVDAVTSLVLDVLESSFPAHATPTMKGSTQGRPICRGSFYSS